MNVVKISKMQCVGIAAQSTNTEYIMLKVQDC